MKRTGTKRRKRETAQNQTQAKARLFPNAVVMLVSLKCPAMQYIATDESVFSKLKVENLHASLTVNL